MCTISLMPLSRAARFASCGIFMPMISSAGEIGVDAGPVDAIEDVGVDVDQAGRDDLTGRVDRPGRLGAPDVRCDAGDRAALNGDVAGAGEPGGRIDDVATFEQEIVHGVLPEDLRL